MSALAKTRMTAAEYLAFERASDTKHEFIDGVIYAMGEYDLITGATLMAGASRNHGRIILSVARLIGNQIVDRPCEAYMNDMRVKINTKGNYVYPDVVVTCDDSEVEDEHDDTLLNPTVIVEVLSRSTERYDRGLKFTNYRALNSLQEYVLISQNAPAIEHYRRQPNNQWLLTEVQGLEAVLQLPSIDCTLALSDVYAKVKFDSPPPTIAGQDELDS